MLVDGVEVPDEKAPEEVFEEFFNTALELPLPGEDEKVKTAEEVAADTKLAEETKDVSLCLNRLNYTITVHKHFAFHNQFLIGGDRQELSPGTPT